MKYSAVFLLILLSGKLTSQAPAATSDQEKLNQLVQIIQQVQSIADGLPLVQNSTQKVLNQLSQFTGTRLFNGNPCSFFENIFRTLLCTISSLDPTGRNPAIQGLLQFLNANEMFCSFAPFGGGSGGGGSNNNNGSNGNSGNGNSPSANGCPPTSVTGTGITDLPNVDDPVDF